jgi:hypothetical protein
MMNGKHTITPVRETKTEGILPPVVKTNGCIYRIKNYSTGLYASHVLPLKTDAWIISQLKMVY